MGCSESVSENDAYEFSQRIGLDDPLGLHDTENYRCLDRSHSSSCCGTIPMQRHQSCWWRANDGRDLFIDWPNVPLLSVSKTLRCEARSLWYNSTTFSFGLAHTFKTSANRLAPSQRQHIKNIHLDMHDWCLSESWTWESDNIPNTMSLLSGLRTLHISIHRLLPGFRDCMRQLKDGTLPLWKDDIVLFRHHLLQEVTFMIDDSEMVDDPPWWGPPTPDEPYVHHASG